jgi:hypothetical protein
MADILADPVEICFGSFTVTSTTLAAATSPTASVKVPVTSGVAPSSGRKSKTHPPKPYDLVQGWSVSSIVRRCREKAGKLLTAPRLADGA